MRFVRLLFLVSVVALAVCVALPAQAESVPVGSSSLIQPGTLDYSDTFTACLDGCGGTIPDRDGRGGWCPGGVDCCSNPDGSGNGTPGEGLIVENNYGNPVQWWSDCKWSFNRDGTALPGALTPYPGNSKSDGTGGSATGMTQTGPWGDNWGIEYGLPNRERYVVQYDGVQSADRMDLMTGGVRDNLVDPSNICVFVRASGGLPEISVFNVNVGEVGTTLTSGLATSGAWHNYAALFDIPERSIEVFVDEGSRGVIYLDLLPGDPFAAVPLLNDAVSVGFWSHPNGDRMWTDNFQVGAAIPEPGTFVLLLSGLAGLFAVLRRKKA